MSLENDQYKCETLKSFCFLFRTGIERIFIKMPSTEGRCVIGPEYVPFAGASVHLSQPGGFTGLGSEGVKL